MGHVGGVDHPLDLQLDVGLTDVVEQSDPVAEQQRVEMNPQFVEQSDLDGLANGVPTARDVDVLLACGPCAQ